MCVYIYWLGFKYIGVYVGEKLAARLRELEAEKSRLEWEREEEACRRKAEEAARAEHQTRIQARERELCKQEVSTMKVILKPLKIRTLSIVYM